jgi:hypothetical protein
MHVGHASFPLRILKMLIFTGIRGLLSDPAQIDCGLDDGPKSNGVALLEGLASHQTIKMPPCSAGRRLAGS